MVSHIYYLKEQKIYLSEEDLEIQDFIGCHINEHLESQAFTPAAWIQDLYFITDGIR